MKKTKKQLYGFAGLLLVTAMTAFAAALPNPEAEAVSSVTDNIVVRVIASTPHVDTTNPKNNSVFVNPNQTISYNYEKVDTVTVDVEYRDDLGNVVTRRLQTLNPAGQPGSSNIPLDLKQEFGYGKFQVTVIGTNTNTGVFDEKNITFSLYPVIGEANQPKKGDDVEVNLDYYANSVDLDYIEVDVFDANGNLLVPLSPLRVNRPIKSATLPFTQYNLPAGTYTVKFTPFDNQNRQLYTPYQVQVNYRLPDQSNDPYDTDLPVPNTGSFFGGTNISNSDYLITGLIIFGTIGIFGVYFILKDRKDSKKKR